MIRLLRQRFGNGDAGAEMHRTFHQQRAIFVHIPKAAGSSVCLALFGHQVGHYTIHQWRAMDARACRKYFTFTFVREPADRLYSAFRYLQSGGMNEVDRAFAEQRLAGLEFAAFVERLAVDPELLDWIHFRPQHEFLMNEDRVLVDFVGRYENIAEDFATVAARLGRDAELPRFNAGDRPGVTMSDETRRLIRRIYEKDYQAFCY